MLFSSTVLAELMWYKMYSLVCVTLNKKNVDKPYHLLVDASSHTIAGVLTQLENDLIERPIAFFSWN